MILTISRSSGWCKWLLSKKHKDNIENILNEGTWMNSSIIILESLLYREVGYKDNSLNNNNKTKDKSN